MCHQIAKHFLCVCPDRNNPQCCPHAACLRIRAEAAVNDGGGGFVGTGWYTRSSPRGGQRHRVWEPYATVWEHCVAYQLKHTTTDNKKRTGGRVVQGGFEEGCRYTSAGTGKSSSLATSAQEEKKKEEEEEEGGGEGEEVKGKGKVEIRWEMGLCQDCFEGHRNSMQGQVEGGKRG